MSGALATIDGVGSHLDREQKAMEIRDSSYALSTLSPINANALMGFGGARKVLKDRPS